MPPPTAQLHFFLGGRDLEMVTIRELLRRHAPGQFDDHGLAWGARASAYRQPMERVLDAGRTAVLVELLDDLGLLGGERRDQVINVDHHGPLAGQNQPTALEQVFHLLGLPAEDWTRHLQLVAANDRGHVRAMLECGATPDELRAIRAADRAAQGITPREEAVGRWAAERAEREFDGKLLVAELPHGRTATVTDALDAELGGPGFDNLLVLCPGGATFFGQGNAIDALQTAFPQGYYGGELPRRGFWGHPTPIPRQTLLEVLADSLSSATGSNNPLPVPQDNRHVDD